MKNERKACQNPAGVAAITLDNDSVGGEAPFPTTKKPPAACCCVYCICFFRFFLLTPQATSFVPTLVLSPACFKRKSVERSPWLGP